MKMKTQQFKPLRCNKISHKREVESNTGLPQEAGKISKHNLSLHLKKLEKEQIKTEATKRVIIKMRAEINAIRKTTKKKTDQ